MLLYVAKPTYVKTYIRHRREERAWRVENSWGDDFGFDGYLVIDADWFRLYGGDVVVERRFVPEEVQHLWDEAPTTEVSYWDNLLAIG